MEEASLPRKKIPGWLLALTLALAALLLYLSLRKVNFAELGLTLSRGNLGLLALALCSLTISCLVRGVRWRVLLSAEKTLPPLTVFWATMVGYLGNAYFPARLGEVFRSVLIGQKGGISKSFSLATALTERITDAVILVVVSAFALTTLPKLPTEMAQALNIMAGVGALGLAIILIAPRMGRVIQRIINWLPVPENLRAKLCEITLSFLTGAGALQHWGRLAQFLLFSAAIWSIDTVTGLLTASAFGLTLNPAQVIVLLAALGIASGLPSTPGYVGVYQFVAVNVLMPFGLSNAQAIAYILAYQAVQYIAITLWGLIGLWRLRGAIRL